MLGDVTLALFLVIVKLNNKFIKGFLLLGSGGGRNFKILLIPLDKTGNPYFQGGGGRKS